MELVECVPNFSAAKNELAVSKIVSSIQSIDNAYVMGIDKGLSANRTVVTFAGTPEVILEAAFCGIKTASEVIDMQSHRGAHPRLGACDVCPIIPLSANLETCKEVAEKLAKKVANELKIPVYLYGLSAKNANRSNLALIRNGEYEALPQKILSPTFKPDYGEPVFNKRSGATVIGVRELLVAFNVSMDTQNLEDARKIAKQIRIEDKNKNSGRRTVKAIGWYLDDYKCCQVSMNLVDLNRVSILDAFEKVKSLSESLGIPLLGSELVGLAPLEAFGIDKDEDEKAQRVKLENLIARLNLDCHYKFDPTEKIIEYRLKESPYDF